jgi:hypothetical protein
MNILCSLLFTPVPCALIHGPPNFTPSQTRIGYCSLELSGHVKDDETLQPIEQLFYICMLIPLMEKNSKQKNKKDFIEFILKIVVLPWKLF